MNEEPLILYMYWNYAIILVMKTSLIILFGSQATNKAKTGSDFDVAVLADNSLSLQEKDEITEEIAKQLNVSSDKIDLVDLSIASPLLQHSVGQTGRLINGNKEDFLRFRVLAWKRYLDTAKFRARRYAHLKSSISQS